MESMRLTTKKAFLAFQKSRQKNKVLGGGVNLQLEARAEVNPKVAVLKGQK